VSLRLFRHPKAGAASPSQRPRTQKPKPLGW